MAAVACKVMKKVKSPRSRGAAQQRVLVAKDVLKWMKVIRPTPGIYVGPLKKIKDWDAYAKGKAWKEAVEKCPVCQLGAMFVAGVGRFNSLTFSAANTGERDDMQNFLSMFTKSDLEEMEQAFECLFDFRDFGYYTPEERMKLICENIIKNKGNFKPRELLELVKGK